MNNTRTQRRGSQWGERNSYGRSGPKSHEYQRQDRYDYSDDRGDISFEDEEDYDYESDRGIRNRFREDNNDFEDQNYGRGYDENDEEEEEDIRDFQNEYEEEDENAGYSEGGRRGRGSYERTDRDDVREIGRRGDSVSPGGSSYGTGNFSRDFRGYRPYGNSRRGHAADNSYDQGNYGSSRGRSRYK